MTKDNSTENRKVEAEKLVSDIQNRKLFGFIPKVCLSKKEANEIAWLNKFITIKNNILSMTLVQVLESKCSNCMYGVKQPFMSKGTTLCMNGNNPKQLVETEVPDDWACTNHRHFDVIGELNEPSISLNLEKTKKEKDA